MLISPSHTTTFIFLFFRRWKLASCLLHAIHTSSIVVVLTEKPAQKGQECRTLGEVVRAKAAKLTARMRLPNTIWETPRASMILVRVRYSLSRDSLRDSDAGLRDPGPPMPLLPPRGSAFTGIVTECHCSANITVKDNDIHKQQSRCVLPYSALLNWKNSRSVRCGWCPPIKMHGVAPIRDAPQRMAKERWEKRWLDEAPYVYHNAHEEVTFSSQIRRNKPISATAHFSKV